MVQMADTPLLLYHYASYMPSALFPALTGTSPLPMLSYLVLDPARVC